MEKTLPVILQWDESFDIGSDTTHRCERRRLQAAVPVDRQAQQLTIKVDRPQLSPEDIKKLEAAMKEKAKGKAD